jgi:hypothetical protein
LDEHGIVGNRVKLVQDSEIFNTFQHQKSKQIWGETAQLVNAQHRLASKVKTG